jgi:hypothetical protein
MGCLFRTCVGHSAVFPLQAADETDDHPSASRCGRYPRAQPVVECWHTSSIISYLVLSRLAPDRRDWRHGVILRRLAAGWGDGD